MTPAQWQRVKEITADALERAEGDRAGFVAVVCPDDEHVRGEVLRLLSLAGSAGEAFLSEPRLRLHHVFDHPPASDTPYFSERQVVADRFEILEFLNRGGMGEVYAAMDLELREKVAVKTIRPAIACSPAVIDRFKQEVRQTRRITHPNVCRVYDLFSHKLPSSDPAWFLTMELLEGETLAERIGSYGPFLLERALPLIRDVRNSKQPRCDRAVVVEAVEVTIGPK
jgi:eukaryotic-like serine/threonine-protein kinase